ncbi:MAG: IS66 family transposase [Candidatus Hadarchaeota archaeon]
MTCPDCEKLQKIVAELKKEVEELKRRLALHENANTPPSQWRYPTRQNGGQRTGKRCPGRPKGHEGTTRPVPKPDVVVKPEWKKCPKCGAHLRRPKVVKHHIVEEIPEPSPVVVIDFLQFEGDCTGCGAHVVARHPDCPPEGRFGKNLLVQVSLWKYEGRLPHRKIRDMLKWQYGLSVTAASILDITRRVSEWLKPSYEEVRRRVSEASVVYSDWTGMKVDGSKCWTWDFVANTDALIAVRESKGKKVLDEILGRDFTGTIVCDGDKIFPNFTRRLQRCWAHLLRGADWLAEHVDEAKPLQKALHGLYDDLKASLEDDPPPRKRAKLAKNAKRRLRYWLKKHYRSEETRKFVGMVRSGSDSWFTFVTTPGVEPTNNLAERVLREHVVQRKIIGTLRNEKGASIYEINMTMLATWKLRGLDPSQALAESLASAWKS